MHIIAPFFEVESLKMSIIGIGKSASECADVVGVNFDQVVLDSAFEDANIKIGLKDFREKTEDVKSHG